MNCVKYETYGLNYVSAGDSGLNKQFLELLLLIPANLSLERARERVRVEVECFLRARESEGKTIFGGFEMLEFRCHLPDF